MRECTPQSHLEEAFRQELSCLINQYLSFPVDATLGKIVRTLVSFQQARASLEGSAVTLVLRTKQCERVAIPTPEGHNQGRRPEINLRLASH